MLLGFSAGTFAVLSPKPNRRAIPEIVLAPSRAPSGANTELQESMNARVSERAG